MEIIFEEENIREAARLFLQKVLDRRVFAFSGNLGAGKTTFIASLCREMGVEERVTSPTFSIIQEYMAPDHKPVFHIDLYRLKNESEAIGSGAEDCINGPDTCLVEWPERAPGIFPPDTVFSTIEILSPGRRKLIINDNG